MPKAYLIFNPAAGRFPPEILLKQPSQTLQEHGWALEIFPTHSAEHITQLARQATEAGMDALFVAGGDGSISRAAAGIIGSQTALGVLPAGTGNVWAREIGLPGLSLENPTALKTSAQLLAKGKKHAVDVGFCNQVPFLLWAGFGLDGRIVNQIEARRNRWKRQFAVLEYGLAGLQNVASWSGAELKIHADSHHIEGHFMLAVVSNIRNYMGRFAVISPNARLNDGIMEFWMFSGGNIRTFISHIWNLITGNHVRSKNISSLPIHRLTIESESPIHLQVDGEPLRSTNLVQVAVHQQALQVLVPASIPESLFLEETKE